MHYQLGDFENAAVYAGQAMQLNEKIGNREGRMFTDQTIGQIALTRGDWPTAENAFFDMLRLSRHFDNRIAEAVANAQLARTAYYQGRLGSAKKFVDSGFKALEGNIDPRGIVELALMQTEIELEFGMQTESGRSLEQADKHLASAGSLEQRAEWLRLSAIHSLRAGEVETARRLFGESVAHATESGVAVARIAAEMGAAEATLVSGNVRRAVLALRDLTEQARAIGHVPLELQSAELLARAESMAGNMESSEQRLRMALSTAERQAPWLASYWMRWQLADVLRSSGHANEAERQGQEAREELMRSAPRPGGLHASAFRLPRSRKADRGG